MLLRTLALLAGLCLATPALAQTSITLDAAPVALIDAEINGRPVRLEVDPRMPDMLAHYDVAEAARARLAPGPLADLLAEAPDAYAVGAQGPDFLFYAQL